MRSASAWIDPGDLVGDVAVDAGRIPSLSLKPLVNSNAAGRSNSRQSSRRTRPERNRPTRSRGPDCRRPCALFDHLGRSVPLVPFEEPIGNLSENDDALGRLLVGSPQHEDGARPRSSICTLRWPSGKESASCTYISARWNESFIVSSTPMASSSPSPPSARFNAREILTAKSVFVVSFLESHLAEKVDHARRIDLGERFQDSETFALIALVQDLLHHRFEEALGQLQPFLLRQGLRQRREQVSGHRFRRAHRGPLASSFVPAGTTWPK